MIDGGVGNDFLSLGASWWNLLSLGGAGEDTITIAGSATQWLVDGGDGDDTIASLMQLSAPQSKVAVVLTASTSALSPRVLSWVVTGNDTIKVTGTGVTSASLKAGVGDDLMSITGGITDGSLFGGTGNDSFDFTGGQATGVVDTGSGV